SLASRRHCSRLIFSGYGNAHRLIDFLNAYFLRPGFAACGVALAANPPAPVSAAAAAAEAARSSRRSGEYGPDIGGPPGRGGDCPLSSPFRADMQPPKVVGTLRVPFPSDGTRSVPTTLKADYRIADR